MNPLFAALLASSFTVGGLVAVGTASAKDLAVIDKTPISDAEFVKWVNQLGAQGDSIKQDERMRERFLNHLVDRAVLANAGAGAGVEKTDEFKMQMDEARKEILASIYLRRFVESAATEDALKKHFADNKKQFSREEVKASHILLAEADKAKAEEALKEAMKGGDFDALVKKYSSGPSAGQSGDLGYFTRGRMVPEFEEAAFATENGKVHPKLIKSRFGYHVIKVTDRRGTTDVKFEDVKEEVRQQFNQNEQKAHLDELRNKAGVKIYAENLKDIKFAP